MRIKDIFINLSNRNRIRKYKLFIDYFQPSPESRILDVGASEREYQEGANILEKLYTYPENITVLGIDKYKEFCERYPKTRTVTYEGGTFPFKDKEFDLCWCNAVIEHVGDREKQMMFLKEIKRVSKRAFVTTPNKNFIYESHTKLLILHYLPKKTFDRILIKLNKPWATGNYMHLLGRKDLVKLLKQCNITEYKIEIIGIGGFTIGFVILF